MTEEPDGRHRWRTPTPCRLLAAALSLALVPQLGVARESAPGRPAAAPGVVVEEVAAGSAAARAGLEPGDVLVSWEREAAAPANPDPARGEIRSPVELLEVESEQAPRGVLRLAGTRRGEPFAVVLPPGEWRLVTRPQLAAAERDDALLTAWARERLAQTLARQNQPGKAVEAYRQALEARASLVGSESPGGLLVPARRSLATARIMNRLGTLARVHGDRARAEAYHRRALAISRAEAPGSLAVAASLDGLGIAVGQTGDLQEAVRLFRRALAIAEEQVPGGVEVSRYLRHLGIASTKAGDLLTAARTLRRVQPILESLAPGSLELAAFYSNLGVVARERGDLVRAEEYFRRDLALEQKWNPGGPSVALSLYNLGALALYRQDLDAAEGFFRDGLAIQEKLASGGRDHAATIGRLGSVAFQRGDLAAAEALKARALAIWRRIVPEGGEVALELKTLGRIALRRGDLTAAEARFEEALEIEEAKRPASLGIADTLTGLGEVAARRGELDDSGRRHRAALAIRQALAPGSVAVAESHHRLGVLQRQSGHLEGALDHFGRALDALDAQGRRLGGSYEVRSAFAARHGELYHDYIALAVETGKVEAAFLALERFRTRIFSEMVAERDLSFAADIPEELERSRRLANAEYDRLLGQLARMSGAAGEAEGGLRRRLREAQRRRDEVNAEIRVASPRLAALQHPDPSDLASARRALDPGTLLLSYAVGAKQSFLFTLGPGALDLFVVDLGIGEAALREEVTRWRSLLRPGQPTAAIHFRGVQLTDRLLAPVADRVLAAKRVLVLPDGPLHGLPFAALPPPGATPEPSYLIEEKPVTVAASAAAFAQVRNRRRRLDSVRVTAFGDPTYPIRDAAPEAAGPALRSALRSGMRLDPIPGTREEVESLRSLFPRTSRAFLGSEATEENAKALAPQSSILHFACHGMADTEFPLESALALTIPSAPRPNQENGLLQAWEIIEQIRVDADLVTLSACDSAAGKELGGEGILGLVRAFRYAGARSVLATLWEVNDRSTARLMQRFYRYLTQGETKDEALRRAQVDLIRGRGAVARFAHPFYWAAFKLVGDWH